MKILNSWSSAAAVAFSAVGLLAALANANANVIDFAGLGSTFGTVKTYTQDGMTFTDSLGFVGPNIVQNNFAGPYGYPSTLTVKNTAGSGFNSFDFTSEQFSMFNNADPASVVTFLGTKIDGSTISKSFTVPGYSVGIETFSLTGFTNLTRLDESLGFVTFQNFTFTPGNATANVPEPGSIALLALGIFGFAVARRKSGINNA